MPEPADILIVGAGLAGSCAAALLARQGVRVVLVDRAPIQSPVFKAEKLEPDQIELLSKFGLMDRLLPSAGRVREIWDAQDGRVLKIQQRDQFGILYQDIVNGVRATLEPAVQVKIDRVRNIRTSCETQCVSLASGEECRARLVALACGTAGDLHARLGMRKRTIQSEQSLAFGFDVARTDGYPFPFEAATYYPDGCDDRVAYLTLFRIRDVMRANLFVFWSINEAGTRSFVRESRAGLARFLPKLTRVIGEFDVSSEVEVGRVDLYQMEGHVQPGIVLLGDAYQSVCPTTGTGLSKVLTDVDVFCHECAAAWLSTPGMSAEKIARFYENPRKVEVDRSSLHGAWWQRQMSTNGDWRWRARRAKQRWALQAGGVADYFRFTRKLTA